MLAVDFVTVETIWLQRLYVLFFGLTVETLDPAKERHFPTPNTTSVWRSVGRPTMRSAIAS